MKPDRGIAYKGLKTKRLVLRKLKLSDHAVLHKLRTDPEVNRYLIRKVNLNKKDTSHFIRTINEGIKTGRWIYWVIIPKNRKNLIGTICLWKFSYSAKKAEIGYELTPRQQGKGIMQEAVDAVHVFAWEKGFVRVEAEVSKKNMASIRLLKRNGYKLKIHSQHTEPGTRKYSLNLRTLFE